MVTLDNHLMGLELVARESGLDCPAIFQDAAYSMFNHFKLSTSQVATNSVDMYMGYGPVCPDGYGCCYNPLNDEIIFIVSSFSDCQSTCSKRFRAAIENSLNIMGEICTKFHKKRSSSFGKISHCSFEYNLLKNVYPPLHRIKYQTKRKSRPECRDYVRIHRLASV